MPLMPEALMSLRVARLEVCHARSHWNPLDGLRTDELCAIAYVYPPFKSFKKLLSNYTDFPALTTRLMAAHLQLSTVD